MIRYYDPEDIRQADVLAVTKFGFSSLRLMDNAGTNAAREVLKNYPEALSFLIFAGPGSNGGDGFVAARFLLEKGLKVTLILSTYREKYSGDARASLDALIELKDPNCSIKCSLDLSDSEIYDETVRADCLIDALLGTGSKGAPRNEISRLIRFCNKNGAVVSFDIPSGIDPFTGNIYDPCVMADLTVTFLAAKKGMCCYPASAACGTVKTADIGISPDKALEDKPYISSFDRNDISLLLPPVKIDTHKGQKGGLLILGGSAHYRGAPLLAGLGALRSGAGLVVLALPDFMVDSASLFLPEAIFLPLRTKGEMIVPECIPEAISIWEKRCGAAVIGPGLGRNEGSGSVVSWFWNNWDKPLLADGDALYYLQIAKNRPLFRKETLITPHCGEAASILGTSPEEINSDRISSVTAMSEISETVLLKGLDTLVCTKGGNVTIIKEGSPALAVPGSGDVLSGAVGALMASGIRVCDATLIGAAAHGAAGSLLEKKYGSRGALAREIADALPYTLNH